MDNNDDTKKSNTVINNEQSNKVISSNSETEENNGSSKSSNSDLTNNSGTVDSNSYSLDLAVLNEISKIAKMGMDSIAYLSSKVTDQEMRKQLVAIYSQYGNIQSQINEHFEAYGEIPDSTPLKDKIMGFAGVQFNTLKNKTNSHIAEIMIQGTLMGIISCQKILNRKLDIKESTTKLLKDFNKFQRENINKLNAYL